MSKPVRVLQAAVAFALLSGCATPQSTALSSTSSAPQATPNSERATPQQTPGAPLAAPRAPIKASVGSSDNRNSFLDANGELEPDVQAFALEVAQTREVPLNYVQDILRRAQYNATVARLMTPAKTRIRRSWITYRDRVVEPIRIKAGVEFWTQYRSTLDQTASTYGVPPSIIVAIIGVETIYGRQTGNFLVLDALATLGFRNPDTARPERSRLFRDQLADLILLDYQKKIDGTQVKGSFAGAIGLPQFMPGSLMRYAIDGDNDGQINLLDSAPDAIASVARFLKLHGWQPGLPVFAPVVLPANASSLVAGGLKPSYDWAQLKTEGAALKPGTGPGAWQSSRLGVIDLPDEPRNLDEYRTGTPNFFAITQYNRSYFYAASVADLAEALAGRMGYGGPN
ncbi:MAG TPA: lytic murein transglycosylase B [Paralcaligenes sp.]|jgi:membrane-bound lytic murein transglycosylase B